MEEQSKTELRYTKDFGSLRKHRGVVIVPLNGPTITKPITENEKNWYLASIPTENLKYADGEMWVTGRLDSIINRADNAVARGLFGKTYSFELHELSFKTFRSESGKSFMSITSNDGNEYMVYKTDPIANSQTLYPPITTAEKKRGRSIIGVLATPKEWAEFNQGQGTDPKIEVLM